MSEQPQSFEPLGYFETYSDALTGKVLGNDFGVSLEPGRAIGFRGQIEKTLTKDFVLKRGHRDKLFRASLNKPVKVTTIIFPISGKVTWNHPNNANLH